MDRKIVATIKRVIGMLPTYADKVWSDEPNNVRCDIDQAKRWLADLIKDDDPEDFDFRAMLDLIMCSAPWPVDGNRNKDAVINIVNDMARSRGFDSWVDAYHYFNV